jgi:hypothetical protein
MDQSMKSEAAPQEAVAPGELNQGCLCITLDRDALRRAFEEETGDPDFCGALLRTRPHLYANVAVFVSADTISQMLSVVRIIEAVSALPAYREAALAWAPTAVRFDPGPIGAFMGYDFHVTGDGPKLIEINTNAGGAFLTAPLARAQKRCCEAAAKARSPANADGFDAAALRMFEAEWHRQGRAGKPGRVAIVDDDPEAQFLYPEFILAQRFFAKHGIEAVVADGKDLAYERGVLTCEGLPIDLVYNRLVDFSLDHRGPARRLPGRGRGRDAEPARARPLRRQAQSHPPFGPGLARTSRCDAERDRNAQGLHSGNASGDGRERVRVLG